MSPSPQNVAERRPLRILMVHNHYLVRGGEDTSFAAERDLLRAGGHQVEVYVRKNEEIAGRASLRTVADTIWSRQSRREVGAILSRNQFDVMHVQNSFPLVSPSVYGAAREAGVAVVQTLRNYRPLCANGLFMRDKQICEKCLGGAIGWSGIRHRCYRGSRKATTVVVAMNAWHRARATYLREVDRFIVAAEIVRRKFVEGGFPGERIRVKPNVVPDLPDMKPGPRERRAVYVGRLSQEKGVIPLVEAWIESDLQIPLRIVGAGPLEGELKAMAEANPSISFVGHLPVEEACREIAESELLLLPCQCYETFGRTVLEAYAMGTAVITSRGTAPGDLVLEEETGYLVDPGDVGGLGAAVNRFFALPEDERRGMGQRGLVHYRTHFNRESNRDLLISIYREAMASADRGGVA